jgi:hypothetical protein
LGNGFVVAEGTILIGDPVPTGVAHLYNDQPIVDDGWVATLIVDGGRPRAVVANYLTQAEQAGLVGRVGQGCFSDDAVLLCAGFARSPDRNPPRSLSVEVVRGSRADVVSNHVVVRFSTIQLFWEYGVGDDDPAAATPAAAWPPLPDVGEPIGTAGETQANAIIQEGSRLAGPPHLYLDDSTGGIVAMLEVTGEPREVLDRYLDHLTSMGLVASEPEVLDLGGAVLTTAHASESGGDGFVLQLVERPGRPPWLRLTGSHD